MIRRSEALTIRVILSYPNLILSMDMETLIDAARRYWPALILFVAGILIFGYGLFSAYSQDQSAKTAAQTAKDFPSLPPVAQVKQLTVDVEGAVVRPGVYQLAAGSRIQDALIRAGGLALAADRQVIAKSVNLAQPLTDGVKIYLPQVGEQAAVSSLGKSVAGMATTNINTATESDLEALSGVGPVTAGKIIAGRPYQSVDELLQKKVLTKSVYDKVKDRLSVY